MKLERIYIDNYKCLVNFELKFEPLTVLLGPNGSGKSTVLDLLKRLFMVLCGQENVREEFPPRSLTRWMQRREQIVELEAVDGDRRYVYRLVIEHDEALKQARVTEERLGLNGHLLFEFVDGEVQLYRDDHSPGPRYPFDWSRSGLATILPRDDNRQLTEFVQWFASLVVVRPVPRRMIAWIRDAPSLIGGAEDFASWYYDLVLERQDVAFNVVATLQEVLPGFVGLNLPERNGGRLLEARFAHEGADLRFDFDELSDGQREIVFLYAMLAGYADSGATICIDEPTTALALQEIQTWAIALAEACESQNMQAIVITHHPEMIDYLASRQAIWMEREGSGPVRAQLLEEKHIDGGLRISELIARRWIP